MKYSFEQIEALKKLRERFFEKGFIVYNLKKKHHKHKLEFIVIELSHWRFTSAICRLYRGGIRIQFFEHPWPWPGHVKDYIKLGITVPVYYARHPFNPTHEGNIINWNKLVPRIELVRYIE